MHRFVEIWTSQSPKSRLIRHCRSCLCHMCFLKEKHSTSKSSQVHKNTFCSSFVHQLTTHVTYYTYWDLSTNSCRGFFCWVFFERVVSCRPAFYVVLLLFFHENLRCQTMHQKLKWFFFFSVYTVQCDQNGTINLEFLVQHTVQNIQTCFKRMTYGFLR